VTGPEETDGKGRVRVEGGVVLNFAPHVRFRFDEVRQAWVVLAPERLLLPDENAVEILRLIDGERDVDAVVDELARRYEAPREVIAADVVAMLQDLADKRVLRR
jgi:pyrroloquinoline quinone biosynthesis protein D